MTKQKTRKKLKKGGTQNILLYSIIKNVIETALSQLNDDIYNEAHTPNLFYNMLKNSDCYESLIDNIIKNIIALPRITELVNQLINNYSTDKITFFFDTILIQAGLFRSGYYLLLNRQLKDMTRKLFKTNELNNIKQLLAHPNSTLAHDIDPESLDMLTNYYENDKINSV
jgi:hypothetical protein